MKNTILTLAAIISLASVSVYSHAENMKIMMSQKMAFMLVLTMVI